MTDISTLDVAKGILRFFRRQPLAQLAIAASLWIPLTLLLRLCVSGLGAEPLIETAVAPWSFQAASAGLAYLGASTFLTLSNRLKATGRRKARTRLREQAQSKKKVERDDRLSKIRNAISALEDSDRAFLRLFVDHKTNSLPLKALKSHADAIRSIEGLNWVWSGDGYDPNIYLREYLYNLLLEHPSLVGSEKNSVLVHDRMRDLVFAYTRV